MVAFATQVKRRRGTTAQNDAFTGAEGEIVVDTERHELRVHDGVTRGGFKIGGGGSGRNIGDIFMTKRTDSGLSGAVECNGGTYNTTDYDGDGSIGELLEAGKLDYISLTDYATAINTKGWCDKIGWNGAGTTSFKVPTLTPRIIQTNNISVVGNGITLGLTNGTTDFALGGYSGNSTSLTKPSAFNTNVNATDATTGSVVLGNYGITTDPTKSGIIADTSDTAQLRVMIQLTGGATDEAFATCSEVLADVADLKTLTEGMIDYVIESQEPTSANGYTWYRKYKSGWVEQGSCNPTNITTGTITLPIEMADTNYTWTNGAGGHTGTGADVGIYLVSKTTTSFSMQPDRSTYVNWQVSGMSAQ